MKKSNHPFHNGNEIKFLKSMMRGNEYSRRQVQHIFKLKNPSAAIIRMEEQGYHIGREYKFNKKSKTTTVKYYYI